MSIIQNTTTLREKEQKKTLFFYGKFMKNLEALKLHS